MKYIITESRLHEIMTDYLNSFSERATTYRIDSYIILTIDRDNDLNDTEIEYDHSDGRLFIDKSFLKTFSSYFARDIDYSNSFISKWFEKKYDVEVEFTQS